MARLISRSSIRDLWLPWSKSGNGAADRGRNHSQLIYQLGELIGIERLSPIRQCFIRVMVHLDQKHVSASSYGRPRHGSNFVANPDAVRGVGSHGQVRELVDRKS